MTNLHPENAAVKTKHPQKVIEIHNLKNRFWHPGSVKKCIPASFQRRESRDARKIRHGKIRPDKMHREALHAEEGSIEVLGENVGELSAQGIAELRTKIGFLFQSGALYDSMTVRAKSGISAEEN